MSMMFSTLQSPRVRLYDTKCNTIPIRRGKGNPWQCDCYTEWLRQYLLVRQVQHDIVCTAPPHVRGARLSSLPRALECLEPVIAAPDPVLSVLEHKNTTLTCLVSGESSSSVSWFKDIIAV